MYRVTREELAEWRGARCAVCGAPGARLAATVRVVSEATANVNPDGTLDVGQFEETGRKLVAVWCDKCGHVLLEE